MRGVSKIEKKSVDSSSTSTLNHEKILQNTIFHESTRKGPFEDLNVGNLKKVTTTKQSGVQTESFTSDGYVFQFLNYGQVCSDSPIMFVR